MATKSNLVSITEARFAELIAAEAELKALKGAVNSTPVKHEVGFQKPAPVAKVEPTVTPELTAKVIAAVKADPKTTGGKYHVNYSAFLIAMGLKKYGEKAEFKAQTIITAAKGYGLM